MADDQGSEVILPVPAHVEDGSALGSAEPLVAVGGVVRRVQSLEIQGEHSQGMGAVYEGVHRALRHGADDVGDGQHEAGLAGDVVDEEEARAVGCLGCDCVDDLGRVFEGEGDLGEHHLGPAALGCVVQGVPAGVVSKINP